MAIDFAALIDRLGVYIAARGVTLRWDEMAADTPAIFDGLVITLNRRHDAESLTYYLVHSYGSIAAWCLDLTGVQAMFDRLRDAKRERQEHPDRLEAALVPFRAFETLTSEYAVSVLQDADAGDVVMPYSVFFRADLEAITIFHRTGRAPVWRDFLSAWKTEIARGDRRIDPFPSRPIPPFHPQRIERQEVKQGT